MDGEINLKPYAEALWHKAPLIIIVTIIAAVVGYAISSFMAPAYSATALIAIRQPRYNLDFDPRIQNEDEDTKSVYDALPILATSNELLFDLISSSSNTQEPLPSLGELQNALIAEPVARPTLIELTAEASTPELAAELVNSWAALLVNRANQVYGGQGAGQVEFFTNQLDIATTELDTAQAALNIFAASNENQILTNQLEALLNSQAALLDNQRLLTLLQQDVQSLLTQLESTPINANIGEGDHIAAVLVQIRAFNSQTDLPLQIQVGGGNAPPAQTAGDQRLYLTNLANTLNEKSTEIDAELSRLKPEILVTQQRIQEAQMQESELTDAVTLAHDTQTILARKVEESNISGADATGLVQLASKATVPTSPSSPNKVVNAIAAGLLGLIISSAVVIIWQWRRGRETEISSPAAQAAG